MNITKIVPEKKGRLLIYTDKGGAFPLYKKEAALFQIEEGRDLSDEDWEKICGEILQKRVIRRAMYLLQQKDYTESQLSRKLKMGNYPQELIDTALEYVKSFHYIDDFRYACTYIRCHQEEKSRLQLTVSLQKRGVSRELIDRALEEEYESDEAALIRKLLQKKNYDADRMDQKEKFRIYQYLMRRGFSGSAVRSQMGL